MWVSSVDNGPMAQSLMDTGQVTWLREDGFRYRPTRNNISWMVCDMVEKPAKVAALMAQWLVNGWCRETIFNLKLPMKKRYEELSRIWPIFRNSWTSTALTPRSRRASCITIVKR
jgi:23S rRNA (cytidine2498-2'-O)-methyltransferase